MTSVMWFITAIVILFAIFMLAVAIVKFVQKLRRDSRHKTYIIELTNDLKKT